MSDIHGEIARAQQRPSITQVLERMQPDIAKALPKGMDPDRVARLALTVIRQSEMAKAKGTAKTSLAECTPESFAGALLTAVAFGLEPGVDGEAWLVPYGRECTFIPGYKGIAKLYWQHPLARHLDAQAVYENDDFDYELGLHPSLHHKPATGDRGKKITHYYAVASLSTGAEKFEVMTAAEVAAVREASPRRSGDIRDPQHWMERKTVLKQLLKIMPKSTRLQQVLLADEQTGTELSVQQMPSQVAQTSPAAIDYVPAGIDPQTGEVLHEDPGPEPEKPVRKPTKKASPSNGARGGNSSAIPPSGDEVSVDRDGPAQGESAPVADQPETDRPGGGGSGEAEVTAGRADQQPDRMSVKQRAALMTRWSELGLAKNVDREERLLSTTTLLGLEPGSLATSNDLTVEQAGDLLSILSSCATRDDLDARLAGQTPLTGGEK